MGVQRHKGSSIEGEFEFRSGGCNWGFGVVTRGTVVVVVVECWIIVELVDSTGLVWWWNEMEIKSNQTNQYQSYNIQIHQIPASSRFSYFSCHFNLHVCKTLQS